ncbi:tripartite motif-containing protein 6-like [Mizuhopecten yessoensis]|uniref:tripartite motif-containing protein 6-like n=1 Tax=Mizuhopecten yessoensis TaxID=6573 RepID=UPI000B45B555|nr:tripartite motif-containing protein 6-like [Mizuhopecten yessoensis]XP_021340397.1 tripartite motif-containing protein 6-like [Mizuhopecten yessoensis]XP_021340398.1 tripartite motif-containing protein 6-like [Mizuhopecten yessoensis]
MAEGGLPAELDLQLLECPICLERLQQPKSLPCLHSFCQDCLGTCITKEMSGQMASATSFSCPVCRRMTHPVNQTKTKDKWAKHFPTNTVINELLQLKERSSEPLYCKPCQTKGNLNNPASFWCKTMNENFCDTCKVHLHDIIHNDCDILNVTGNNSKRQNKETSAPRCYQHGEKMVRYCEDHQILCCNECVIEDHWSCVKVPKVTEYCQKVKAGSQLEDMQAALKKGTESMNSLVKDFDQQLQTMIQNQEIALQSISDLREKVDKRLDKLQKDITDDLITLFKKERRDMEASSRQCERLMNGMKNTLKSSIKAVEENNNIEMIVLYQRGQAEVESCKSLVTEINKSFTFVSIEHHIVLEHDIIGDNAMGKIVVGKQTRCIPGCHSDLVNPMSERRVKEIGKFNIKSPSDKHNSYAHGVVYMPSAHVVVSDFYNKKVKLFTDKGQYLNEVTVRGNPWDMCLVNNYTVAVAVSSPGCVNLMKVKASKLSLTSSINVLNGKNCYGIANIDGKLVVGTGGGAVYSVRQDGAAGFVYKYNSTCRFLTHDIKKGDTLVSVSNTIPGDLALSRLSADKRCTDVAKVGVVREARGIDVGREGNIYVCGGGSHNVVQMSVDGTHVRELLKSSDGMDNPTAIAVCGDTFVVTNTSSTHEERNYIRLFQLL